MKCPTCNTDSPRYEWLVVLDSDNKTIGDECPNCGSQWWRDLEATEVTMTQDQKLQKVVEAAGESNDKLYHSPTDLKELFRLNKKLKNSSPSFGWRHSLGMVVCTLGSYEGFGETEAEALLNALYEAVKEKI